MYNKDTIYSKLPGGERNLWRLVHIVEQEFTGVEGKYIPFELIEDLVWFLIPDLEYNSPQGYVSLVGAVYHEVNIDVDLLFDDDTDSVNENPSKTNIKGPKSGDNA